MRTTPGTTDGADACAVLDAAARALSTGAAAALPSVLADVVTALGLRSAVLRDARAGDLVAVAGEVVHAVAQRQAAGGPKAVVELPVHACGTRVATLTVVGARPAQLPLLRALCAVVGLALDRRGVTSDSLPRVLLAAADADADAAADDLHDGPVQDLVAARFAADAAVRGGDAVSARDAVSTALLSMRRALWQLRPRGAGDGGLAAALPQLSERLAEAGRPALVLDLDPGACAGLDPHAASVAYRLVQSAARSAEAPVAVAVRHAGGAVRVDIHAAGPLPAPDRWTARARAVGAVLDNDPAGRIWLCVPVAARTSTTPDEIEAIP